MRLHPKAARTMTAIGGAGLMGLAFLAAPALGRVLQDGPPREHPAPPAPPAPRPPEAPTPPDTADEDRDDEEDAADAMAKRVQELAERLSKEAEPIADEVRKTIGDAATILGDTLKRDDASADDIRSALERARDELTRAFQEGGSIDRSAREAIRKAQEEVRADLEKSREEAREALRRRHEAEREGLGEQAPEAPDGMDEAGDEGADRIEAAFREDPEVAELYEQKKELERRLAQVNRTMRRPNDPARKAQETDLEALNEKIAALWQERYHDLRDKAQARDEGEGEADDDGDGAARARRRVHYLQQQLREAQRELQQAERQGPQARRPGPPRGPFGGAMRSRPGRPGPGRPGPGRPGPGRPGPDADRRLDALEAKMDRVLQALEGLKADKPEGGEAEPEGDDD